jgi:Nucleotide modification associated domain 2
MIYAYKMTDDNGGAPCVQDGFLTLAICKPEIRKIAKEDDIIIGIVGTAFTNRQRENIDVSIRSGRQGVRPLLWSRLGSILESVDQEEDLRLTPFTSSPRSTILLTFNQLLMS